MGIGRSIVRRARAFAGRLAGQTRGNVAMIFALSVPALVMMTMGGVDIHRASSVRMNLQDALDAAALAAARSPYSDAESIQEVGMAALQANWAAYPRAEKPTATFILNQDDVVIADAKVVIDTVVAGFVLPPYGQFLDKTLQIGTHSEVNRSSRDLEVALVLDITGSMEGSRMTSLKRAASELVDTVVQDQQSPYYSRMAIVPYSMGVNLGSYASGARGVLTGSVNVTGASWSTGSAKNITGITRANPGVITSSGHGFVTGDSVWISGVKGMTQINDRAYKVVWISNNSFSLQAWSGSAWNNLSTSSGYSNYSSGGVINKCQVEHCSMVVTAPNHGLRDRSGVYITGVQGMTQLNGEYIVTAISNDRYSINENGVSWSAYTRGGRSQCGDDGCEWRVFVNMNGAIRRLPNSTCVSERAGVHAYTDASPTTAWVGRVYPAGTTEYTRTVNPCPATSVEPLSASKSTLKSMIGDLKAEGSTAGQIGAAWGWYAVSPSFNRLWPSQSAGEYDPKKLMKAVILMTDGEFNTPYFEGVIARDAGVGSAANADRISNNATNGDPFQQTLRLCSAMKAKEIVVYTVGFQVAANGNAARVMRDCASGPSFAYLPASNADLSDAFRAIGRDITRLRISR